MSRINFMNTEVDNLTMSEALEAIDELINNGKNRYVVTPNIDHIIQLESDEELQQIYARADLILTDGKPMLWISKLYRSPIKEKVSGSDLFPLLCDLAAQKGYCMFFLGSAEGIAAKAAEILKLKYEGLQIVGTYSPPYGFEKDENEIVKIVDIIQNAKPHILIVGLGCPKQEKFIFHYKERLGVPLSLGLGASFDFVVGKIKRAPRWMRECGLEWLFRITQDPKRMIKRYIIDDAKIVRLVFKYWNRL